MKLLLAGSVWLCLILTASAAPTDSLESGFLNPPESAHPQTWWHWMNGNVTKEGISADLEAMKQIGLGGATIVNVNCGIPAGPVKFDSPEWHEMFKYAVSEADRLGLQLGSGNAAGWSNSGGPWIAPSNSMQHVVTSELQVTGPAHFSGMLPQPPVKWDFYRDIAVFAFRTPEAERVEMKSFNPKVTASAPGVNGDSLLDGAAETTVALPAPSRHHPQFIQIEFSRPFVSRLAVLTLGPGTTSCTGAIQVSEDGKLFRDACPFAFARRSPRSMTFFLGPEGVAGRIYRVVFRQAGRDSKIIPLEGIKLSPELQIEGYKDKDGDTGNVVSSPAADGAVEPGLVVKRKGMIDLTARLDQNGKLDWDVPAGDWTILRVGYTPQGVSNHPAPPEGTGPECDKLSQAGMDAHWAGFMQKLVEDAGPLAGKTFNGSLIDSYEVGGQNWTPNFRAEFEKRRGYDPLPFLPTFTDRVVDNPEISERFLWDVRRTIADLFAENYYDRFSELCREHGLQSEIEPYTGPYESLQSGRSAGVVMGEFWTDKNDYEAVAESDGSSVKLAASVAHIYGKTIVGAESYTSRPQYAGWQETPWLLKPMGDLNYCTGLNRFIFHRYAMQPWTNRSPGMTMGQWGFNFERTITWWTQGKAWIEYLSRCQFLLQQGRYIADAAYFCGESAPVQMRVDRPALTNIVTELENEASMPPQTRAGNPPLPEGYQFDAINADVLLHRATVKDGRLTLPGGASYAVLILPPDDSNMTPPLLRRIAGFVRAGLTVVGPRPQHSPSLENYPRCDAQVKSLAKKLWGKCDGIHVMQNIDGKGRVVQGEPLTDVFAAMNLPPDFEFQGGSAGSDLVYCHRQKADAEIYFVSNQRREFDTADCTFRVSGLEPELWHPETGAIEPAPVWHEDGGRTTVHLIFEPGESVFVVFRHAATNSKHFVSADSAVPTDLWSTSVGDHGQAVVTTETNGIFNLHAADGQLFHATASDVPTPQEITGAWNLSFPPNWGAPTEVTLDRLMSWTDYPDDGVKYFSGTATYEKEIEIPEADFGSNREIWLDLGAVKNFAEVSLNGKAFGVLWKPPFWLNVTSAAKPGVNQLVVKVTNLWPNRLIGDEQLLPDSEWEGAYLKAWPQWFLDGKPSPTGRFTFTTCRHWNKDDQPLASGLLGPVQLQTAEIVPVN